MLVRGRIGRNEYGRGERKMLSFSSNRGSSNRRGSDMVGDGVQSLKEKNLKLIIFAVLGSEEAAKDAIIYSYKAAASGFSAKLTPEQVSQISIYKLQEQDVYAAEMERTFIAIKPDGVQRGLIAEIMSRFERKGFKLVAVKLVVPNKEFAEKHYHDLKERPFFSGLCDFLSSGPVLAMVWEGEGVIKYGRKLIGVTDPQKSEPGTIRGDLAVVVGRWQLYRELLRGMDVRPAIGIVELSQSVIQAVRLSARKGSGGSTEGSAPFLQLPHFSESHFEKD